MKRNRKTLLLVLVSVFLVAAIPTVTSAQGRGRGRGQEKKLDKFVNGHDARDGRWDGRGPRATRVGRRIRDDRIFFPGRNTRRINRGNSILIPRNRTWRNRRIDRDGDGDVDRNDFLLGRRQNRLERLERRRDQRHVRRIYFNRR